MNGTVSYVIPASLLCDAAALLQPPEQMCFATGIKLHDLLGGQVVVLTQLVLVEASSSRAHVRPQPASVLRAHQHLLSLGQDIEVQFHSHPGETIAATMPSSIDLHTARRWETGAPFLGAIFSEGGRFVRFFNYRQHSEVKIYGQHSATAESDCYELPLEGDNLLPWDAGTQRGLVADGSPTASPVVESGQDPQSRSPNRRHWWHRWKPGKDICPDGLLVSDVHRP